jgi:hypothetical protein
MNDHPDTCEFFFIRHAPVVKQPGHVPPADPPIEEMPYALDRLTDLLAGWCGLACLAPFSCAANS